MRCEKARRWMSDRLDGALPPSRASRLEAHIASCAACRAYEGRLKALQAASAAPESLPDADDFAASLRKLRARLEAGAAPLRPDTRPAPARPRRWAWTGAAGVMAAAAGILFLVLRPGGEAQEPYWAARPDALLTIEQAASADPALAAAFESDLRASIRETLGTAGRVSLNPAADTVIFVESLADEDVRLLNEEIGRQIGL